MNEILKIFVIGYIAGIVSVLFCVLGCYLYGRRVRRDTGNFSAAAGTESRQSTDVVQLEDNERKAVELIRTIETTKSEQSSDYKRLENNERTAEELLQKAKDILAHN